MRIVSPLMWVGGKARLAPRITKLFPPHEVFVEVFGGSGAVLLQKKPSRIEVFNDINREIFNLFKVLQNELLAKKLQRRLAATPHSRLEFNLARVKSDDPVEQTSRFIIRNRQSYGARGGNWTYNNGRRSGGTTKRRWRSGTDSLEAVRRRIEHVQIECDDFRRILTRYDGQQTLFYCDPPYVEETRTGDLYHHEFKTEDYRDLISRLLKVRGAVVLSGYNHGTYSPLEKAGWRRIDFAVVSTLPHKHVRRTESLWLNPSALKPNAKMFFTATEKMRHGAFQTHVARVESSTRRVARAIEKFRTQGQKITIVGVARAAKMSREHVGKKYRHLFAA